MATRRGTASARYEGPCSTCPHKANCVPYRELDVYLFARKEFQKEPATAPVDEALDAIVAAYLHSLRKLEQRGRFDRVDLGTALAALVDLCITGVYANALVDQDGEFKQRAVTCGGSTATLPYTWMCPLCVSNGKSNAEAYLPGAKRKTEKGVTRDYPEVEWLAKPGGRAIGDQGIQVVKALLRATLKASGTGARLRDGGGARGEFDLTVATDTTLTFIEVKAKPLLALPIVAYTSLPETAGGQHGWDRIAMQSVERLYLFLGALNERLPISKPMPGNDVWPLQDIAMLAADLDKVDLVYRNWRSQKDVYFAEGEPNQLRWHRFGCGNFSVIEPDGSRVEKRVANTKELPGLDRTDDIKKGAAQVLKYSRLKFECDRRALRAVLLGNTHALSHHNDYVAPVINLKVLASGADPGRAEWIFDAMLGLTQNTFNDPGLADVFAFHRLMDPPAPDAPNML